MSAPRSKEQADRERQRLYLLGCTRLLDTEASEAFDRMTRLAAEVFDVPIALVSLIDEQRQWFKARFGLEVTQTSRDWAFCSHAIQQDGVMVVEDARLDDRFVDNPSVRGPPHVRFYAGAPLRLDSGHALGSLCIVDDKPRQFGVADQQRLAAMAALVMAQIELHQRAGRINEVTRLPNRAQMVDDLEALCDAYPGEQRSLILLDVMSHHQLQIAVRALGIGPMETTMREIASQLERLLDPGTPLYHVAETRYSFLLAGGSKPEQDALAMAILARMREPFSSRGVTVELEVQAGLVEFTLDSKAAADALRKATAALLESVATGHIHRWHDPIAEDSHRRAYALLQDVSPALRRGELRLVFQPKLNLPTDRFSGVEALVRWRHPRFGDISPAEFIPLVESTMLIHEFTEWVVQTALAQLKAWQSEGLSLSMAVNVSARNLDRPGFVDKIREACRFHQVDPRHLHIECTEHSVMTSAATQAALLSLRELGVQISLDDFGMGFSNLSCLSALPVDMLKLDQSLIKPIASEPRAWLLVKSLIDLGHSLGYRMLAEGVETQEVFDLLAATECDAVQGYFLSRPLEACALPSFLAKPPAGSCRQ